MTLRPPRPRRLGRLAAATVLAALALTGCSAPASSSPAAPASPRVGPVTATTLLTQTFGITALSTVMITDQDGTVTYRDVEPSTGQITRALQQGGTP